MATIEDLHMQAAAKIQEQLETTLRYVGRVLEETHTALIKAEAERDEAVALLRAQYGLNSDAHAFLARIGEKP